MAMADFVCMIGRLTLSPLSRGDRTRKTSALGALRTRLASAVATELDRCRIAGLAPATILRMVFKRLRGLRAVIFAVSGFGSIGTAIIGYADMTERFLPPELRMYWPLIIASGFALALVTLGTTEDKDPEPSLVLTFGEETVEDEHTGEPYDVYYVGFRNVGHYPLTKVRFMPSSLLGISVRAFSELPAISPADTEQRLSITGISMVLSKVAKATRKSRAAKKRVVTIPITIECYDWRQDEKYTLHYAMSAIGTGYVDIARVRNPDAAKWTDLEKFIEEHQGRENA